MPRRIVFSFLLPFLLTLVLFHTAFAQNEKKVVYGILIDNTGSLRTQFSEVVRISKGIVDHIHPRGPVSLFSFRTEGDQRNPLAMIGPGTEWSQDKDIHKRYIDTLFVIPGQTTLLDAIDSLARKVNAKAQLDNAAFGDKIIILITDGEDRISKIKKKQLIQTLKEGGIKVYAVGLVQELDSDSGLVRKASKTRAMDFLREITKETSGRVTFPKSDKHDVGGLLKELFDK